MNFLSQIMIHLNLLITFLPIFLLLTGIIAMPDDGDQKCDKGDWSNKNDEDGSDHSSTSVTAARLRISKQK